MKPLTRLSLSAWIAGITLAVAGIAYITLGASLFSPGPLNASVRAETPRGGVHSHAELNQQCGACHARPFSGRTMEGLCQDCHEDVRQQIERAEPLHGKLAGAGQCRSCHGEHKGPGAALTSFERFDHGATRFPLTGAHAGMDCTRCHKDHQYRGTPATCAGCHAEPKIHLGRFGTACADCHSTKTWKGAKFDHASTGFPLTGGHAGVDCARCHKQEDFRAVSSKCADCHAEPKIHLGKFGTACADCHSTSTWKGAKIDHRFPLNHGAGRRRTLECATCHTTPGDYKAYSCCECHEHERSRMERKHRRVDPLKLDHCAACHPGGREKPSRRLMEQLGLGAEGSERRGREEN